MDLTFGVVAGGLVTLSAPSLAGLGAVAALVRHVRLEVTRSATDTAAAFPVVGHNPPPAPDTPTHT